jgi:integrase
MLGLVSDSEGGAMSELLLDRAGRRRSPATMPGFHAGRPPQNKGLRYPADPPTIEEIIAVMHAAGESAHGRRLRALVVILWRAGLRIQEALALTEADLDHRRGAVLVRRGKGGRRREVGMDAWAWDELQPWIELRLALPVGPLLCVVNGSTRGRHWSSAAARATLPPDMKECPLSSSNDSSATATSASLRSTFEASTTRRSSRPSTPDARP